MFHGKCVDEGDKPNIYNIKGDTMLSPGLHPLTTRNAIIILSFSQSASVIVFTIPEMFLLLSSIKQHIQVFKHLKVVSV